MKNKMKKFLKFLKRNALTISMLLFLFIVFIIGLIILASFLPSNDVSIYGNRLDGIENYPITDETYKNAEGVIKTAQEIGDVSFVTSGRIINVHITIANWVGIDGAIELVSNKVLEAFSDDIKGYYDIQIFLSYTENDRINEETGEVINGSYKAIGYKHYANESFSW